MAFCQAERSSAVSSLIHQTNFRLRKSRRPVAASCSFDRNQFILYIVQLQEPRVYRAIFEMKRSRLNHVSPKFIPGIRFCKDAMAERSGEISAFLSVPNFEDQLHVQ